MNDITSLKGVIRFAIKGQDARLPWERKALAKAIIDGGGAPNDLRFQCRVAQDARDVFAEIPVKGGVLTIHQKSKPQFGRDQSGRPYLTVVLVDSRDGESYKVRWLGDAIPRKMQEVAVKHDEGKRVSATRVALRWEDAEITRSEHVSRPRHDVTEAGEMRKRPDGKTGGTKRTHGRLCATDLATT